MYKIVRFYAGNKAKHTVPGMTGLTLEEAQKHCEDPESSSDTCTNAKGKRRTRTFGAWFDGYYKQ